MTLGRPRLLLPSAIALVAALLTPSGHIATAQVPSAVPATVVTILDVSDFHGTLEPTTTPFTGAQRLGGAAHLQTYFEQRARTSPTPPFVVTAGDAVGATQPISGLLGDRPTIDVMNAMGFDVDTLGNHNFDSGVAHMAALARRADYPFVVSNVVDRAGRPPPWTRSHVVWTVDGVRIGVTGAMNRDAPRLLPPGRLGPYRILDEAEAVSRVAARLRARGINTVVALVHLGATPLQPPPARGPLMDFARRVRGVDLVIGDHTNWQVNEVVVGGDGRPVRVVENFSYGVTFSDIRLVIDRLTGAPVWIEVTFFPTAPELVEPDPRIQAIIDRAVRMTRALREEVIGLSTVEIPRSIPQAESNQGNLVTDAIREATGAHFAFQNTGGLRAGLTEPDDREASGRYRIRREYILATLPFHNRAVTFRVNGPELKAILEHGVSAMPQADGRFIQVSGLEFEYSTACPDGDRVFAVRYPDGRPVDLSARARYRVAMNDFMLTGGDGYPNHSDRATFDGDVVHLVEHHVDEAGTVSPPGPVPPATAPETRIFRRATCG